MVSRVNQRSAAVALAVLVSVMAGAALQASGLFGELDSYSQSINLDRGAAGLSRWLAALKTRASIIAIVAHPDDEDGGMLVEQTRGLGARGALLTLTRGEGGQNAMSSDMYDELGLLRTQELLTADRYYGVDQFWGREIDYGFSKTREEALDKWGYERTLSDTVRVIRMTRPLVITSTFAGASTDGHGNHQVSGQMAQEAYLAAADPKRFPEQIAEGLRPWAPLKVYGRVPFFTPTKQGTMYDYATDQYVPLRFFDYVNKTWLTQKPSTDLTVDESAFDPAVGLTFAQISREGWGFQKSQNGGGTLPQPAPASVDYHRYGTRVNVSGTEKSFYDGIDVSLLGIASLAQGDTGLLQAGLARFAQTMAQAGEHYRATAPNSIAPDLADGLKQIRALQQQVQGSALPEPGKSDVLFELKVKEDQCRQALILALGISFDAAVAPDKEATGPFAAFAGPQPTFGMAIPGQSFRVQTSLMNLGDEPWSISALNLSGAGGPSWTIKTEAIANPALAPQEDLKVKSEVTVPQEARLTRPYYTRPNQEQAYYDLIDAGSRSRSTSPYPLTASATVVYRGEPIGLQKVVQAYSRVEGIGLVENPLLVGPAIGVTVAPGAGAVPLTSKEFEFSCNLHSNVKGPAKGSLRLQLPPDWQATPQEYPFSLGADGENQTVSFQVTPHGIKPETYTIRAVADYAGKTYTEGYRTVGYAGVRSYPYYRNAVYKATGVDVTTAPGLNVAFIPGTGDDVPQALHDLQVPVQVLSASDIERGNLSGFDAIVLGVRAYAVRPELRSNNARLLSYVQNGGTLVVQYNVQNFDRNYGPYPFSLGQNPEKVVEEDSKMTFLDPSNPALLWPNRITALDFKGWEEERGHGFLQTWDDHYKALVETHDAGQKPQAGGLLVARCGKGFYVYDAYALYRQLPAGVPGAYRLLANLVSLGKNPDWK